MYLYINMIGIILMNEDNVYQYKPFYFRSICILSFNHRCNTQVHTQTFYETTIGGCVLGVGEFSIDSIRQNQIGLLNLMCIFEISLIQ